jgi:RNA polymerase sigma factor (sigma-70 family)
MTTELTQQIDRVDEQEEQGDPVFSVEKINKAISKLPEGYRVVFNLYAVEGYDHEEISQILEISEATSKSQYSRAKGKLRELLAEQAA